MSPGIIFVPRLLVFYYTLFIAEIRHMVLSSIYLKDRFIGRVAEKIRSFLLDDEVLRMLNEVIPFCFSFLKKVLAVYLHLKSVVFGM